MAVSFEHGERVGRPVSSGEKLFFNLLRKARLKALQFIQALLIPGAIRHDPSRDDVMTRFGELRDLAVATRPSSQVKRWNIVMLRWRV